MRLSMNDIENYIGYLVKVFTINDQRIAARLINVNSLYILVENSNGFRNKIRIDEIDSIFTLRNQGGV